MFKKFFYCCQDNEKKDPAILVDTNDNSNNYQISPNILNNDNINGKIEDHSIETIKNIENKELDLVINDNNDDKKSFCKKILKLQITTTAA